MHVVILETFKYPASNLAPLRDRLAPLRTQSLRRSPALRGRARRTRAQFHRRHRVVASSLSPKRTPFGHDAAGNRNAEMDARANTTYYLYDVGNRLANVIDPLGKVAYYGYDANSNLTQTVDNNLTFVYFGYDALDRRTRILYTDGGYGVQPYGTSPYGGLFVAQYFEYDAGGNLSSTLDDWGGSYFAYDTLNRLSKRSTPRVDAVYYGYDAASNLTRLQYPQGLNACYYGYDAAQRMSQLRAPTDNSCYYAYDASSNVARKLFGNAMAGYFTYDAADRVSSIRYVKSDGTPIVYFDYARDIAGRITTIGRETDLAIYYNYDNVDRLTKETWRKKSDNAQVYAFSYSYAPTGNRLQMRRESTLNTETESAYYSYAADNSLTKRYIQPAGNSTYWYYDANGNTTIVNDTSAGATYFEYGPHQLVTAIAPPSEEPSYFFYDSRLNRYCENRAGAVTYFLWDGLRLLEERSGDGSLTVRYTHGYSKRAGIGSTVEAQRIGSRTTYYQYLCMNHRGTAYAVTDISQNVQLTYTLDSFGRQLAGIGGMPAVPNELIYQANWMTPIIGGRSYGLSPIRLYDFETGRFTQRDPLPTFTNIGKSSNSSMGIYANTKFELSVFFASLGFIELNGMYEFVNDNPTDLVDSTGLTYWLDGDSETYSCKCLRISWLGNVPYWFTYKSIKKTFNFKLGNFVARGNWKIIKGLLDVGCCTPWTLNKINNATFRTCVTTIFKAALSFAIDPAARRVNPLRRDVIQQIIDNAKEDSPDGLIKDPNTQQRLKKGRWNVGHKPGFEWAKTQDTARNDYWDRQDDRV
jgi:YD repeat-containing protein